ncbi:kinetochore Sim4 complex subunit FTA2-domain-containing protein [Nemania serpens]|nr:kinetochore Sim4 complex subunit FTA2-domain-containing protein [Nemania serpens]
MASDTAENRRLLSAPELPECAGPKLKAFRYRESPITWLEWIDRKEDVSESGRQGYVFKVKIRSKIYALKVFKFFNPSTYRDLIGPIRGRDVTTSELGFHTDPFFAECRAYAQIETRRKTQGLKRKDIADCYGYLGLRRADEEVLAEYGIDLWRDIPLDDEYRKRAAGSPVRALVKEYIGEEIDLDERTCKKMLAGVKWMNRNKILINDVRAQNFKGGYMLDFGLSWTQPHCLWQNTSRQRLKAILMADISMFEEMTEELGVGPRRSGRSSVYQRG